MKIAACLSLKDEIEILPYQLQHLKAIGVGQIYACDFSSTDGSRALLEREASSGELEIIHFDDQTANEEAWRDLTRDVLRRARSASIDWLMFLDADEFWLPASGQLQDCQAIETADVLVVDRFNVALAPTGPCLPLPPAVDTYANIAMFVRPIPDWQRYLTEDPQAPWITGVPGKKVMARPDRISGTSMAHHDAFPIFGSEFAKVTPDDLVIAHLAFSTSSRFARKIANIERWIEAHPDLYAADDYAWHWGRWARNVRRGGIDHEFQRNCFDAAALEAFAAAGSLMSAADYLRARSRTRTLA
jgi:hypothetical protein